MNNKFTLRKPVGSNVNLSCLICKRKRINKMRLCKRCCVLEYCIVDSRTKNIDDFIKKLQSSENKGKFLEWIPFGELKNIIKIGTGDFGQVYRATWKKFGRSVALKILDDSCYVDVKFLNEVTIVLQFDFLFYFTDVYYYCIEKKYSWNFHFYSMKINTE